MKYLLTILLCLVINIYAQDLPYYESFNDNTLSRWTKVDDEPGGGEPGKWYVSDGVLMQTSNIFVTKDEFNVHLGTHIYTGNRSWKNYSFNSILKSTDDDGIGIIFRYQDKDNYYRLLFLNDAGNGGPFRSLQKMADGNLTTIAEKRITGATPKNWFAVTARVKEDSVIVYLNGDILFAVKDETHKGGAVGFTCYANSGAYFDSVSVTSGDVIYEEPENVLVIPQRMPYIQLPDTSSVCIAWQTTQTSAGRVEYGLTKNYGFFETEDSLVNKHFVKIEGLQPNTKYYYRVWNADTVFSEGSYFYTAKPGNIKDVSFLIWGDSGVNTETQYKIAGLMEKEMADFGIHVGDVSQNTGEEYDLVYFRPYKNIISNKNIYLCIGNHDTYFDNAETYLNEFYLPHNNDQDTERYYSFRWGNAFFINMDSNIDYSPGSPQYQFLVRELQSGRKKTAGWTFVYFHHPPYCELWDTWAGETAVREYLIPLFEEYNVDIVFNGHTHGYEHGFLGGVHYIITGGGGGGLDVYGRNWNHISKSLSVHHYSRVDISGNNLTFWAVDSEGKQIDSFSISKSLAFSGANNSVPAEFILNQNFPNPFNPVTKISFGLPAPSLVILKIYDLSGREVVELVNKEYTAGYHEVEFDGSNFASGIYAYKLEAGSFVQEKKMIILK
jgi:predicted phosphodiesterase